MARGVFAALDLPGQVAGFGAQAVQRVDERGLARAGLAGQGVDLAAKRLPQRVQPFARACRDGHGRHVCAAILTDDVCGRFGIQVGFVDHQHGLNSRAAGVDEHPVGQRQVGVGRSRGDYHDDAVDVGHRRARQFVAPGQNLMDPAVFLALAGGQLHSIAHLRLEPFPADFSLRAQRVDRSAVVHGVIEAADSAQNGSLQAIASEWL